MTSPRELSDIAAALVVLARHNIPTDIQELLVRGDPARGIKPGALAAAIEALRESERQAEREEAAKVADFRKNWGAFCDCDPFDGADTFADRMEAAGFIEIDSVTAEDLEYSFASELGIVEGGSIWRITAAGRTAIGDTNGE